jgi:uncharacterized membrane protein YsdA (DUF1294 family)/cold shock CspA family protein
MASPAPRHTGTLSSWDDDRGFGFLTPTAGGRRVFVHISAFPRGHTRPVVGNAVTFAMGTAEDGKQRAVAVRPVRFSGAAPTSGNRQRPAPSRLAPRNGGSNSTARPAVSRRPSAQYLAIVAFAALYAVTATTVGVPSWAGGVYLVLGLVTFVAYRTDKVAATAGTQRVSEGTLHTLGLLGGWPGALIAQQLLRHKTRKPSFRVVFWITVLANTAAFLVIAVTL